MNIINFSIKNTHIEFNEKGYANLTMFTSDTTDNYGQNVSITVSQSQEDRMQKKPKTYVGNGKVVWSENGTIKVADKKAPEVKSAEQSMAGRETPDLPF